MNQYTSLISATSSHEATVLSARLSAWHDAMVMHERRLRLGIAGVACHDECPHAEAPMLWAEALLTFGGRAHELAFLRSRAAGARWSSADAGGSAAAYTGPRPAFARSR
jgi:hypothetical protein